MKLPLKILPPVSFHIAIKGAGELNFRLVEMKQTDVYGTSRQFDEQEYRTREELRHSMWSEDCDFVPGKICIGYDGSWYGIWHNGKYLLAREKADTRYAGLEEYSIPAGTYVAFQTECGGFAWEEFPKLFELVFDSWLINSEYKQKGDTIIEIYHLWTERNIRRKNRYYELWIPIEKDSYI